MGRQGDLIENAIGQGGWHRAHVINVGGPVDREWLDDLIPGDVPDERINIVEYTEPELGVHHLKAAWPARELVKLQGGTQGDAYFWYVCGESLREAAEQAAVRFWAHLDRWPSTLWVRKLPKGATQAVELQCGAQLELIEARWVPKSFLIVGG